MERGDNFVLNAVGNWMGSLWLLCAELGRGSEEKLWRTGGTESLCMKDLGSFWRHQGSEDGRE